MRDAGHRTLDAGHRTTDIGHRTAKKAKIIYPPPRGVDIMISVLQQGGNMLFLGKGFQCFYTYTAVNYSVLTRELSVLKCTV